MTRPWFFICDDATVRLATEDEVVEGAMLVNQWAEFIVWWTQTGGMR